MPIFVKRRAVQTVVETPAVVIDGVVWDLFEHGVTQGVLNAFMTCPEKMRLNYKVGLKSVRGSTALAFGTLVHNALEQVTKYAKSGGHKGDIGEVYSYCEAFLKEQEQKDRTELHSLGEPSVTDLADLEEIYSAAEGLLPGYVKKWEDDFHNVDWLHLEKTFEIPLVITMPDGEQITILVRGKRDGDFKTPKGTQNWLFETKTKGRIEENSIMQRLVFDTQVMLYLTSMWEEYGEVPGGVLYNILRKPGLRQGKTETLKAFSDRIRHDVNTRPEFYFMRYRSAITKSDLVAWRTEFNSAMQQLIRWHRGEFHYKNPSACSMGGFNCSFLPVCSSGDRSNFKVRSEPFPELTEGD